MTSASTALENQKALLTKLFAAEADWDLDAIAASRTPDAVYQMLPASQGRPRMSTEEFVEHMRPLKDVFRNLKLEVLSTMHDAEQHKATIHTVCTATTGVGPFKLENVFLLTFTEDGKKVRECLEFVDSAYLDKFAAELKAAKAKE